MPKAIARPKNYFKRFSRKWRSETRTITALQNEGFVVFPIRHAQRSKNRALGAAIPDFLNLIADDGNESKIIVVRSAGLSENQRRQVREFSRKLKKRYAIELWRWRMLSRKPEIERLA